MTRGNGSPSTNLPAPAAEKDSRALERLPDLSGPLGLVEQLARDYALGALKNKGHFERAIILSRGIRDLRQALKPFLGDIMALMNEPLGFLTDRDPRRSKQSVTPYGEDVVRDCVIHALLKGLYPVGNEFNIIAARQYTTKEGFERLVRALAGLTDLDVAPGVPRCSQGGAVVQVRATWRLHGKPMSLRNEKGAPFVDIPVRLNADMGADAALGKALRKVFARIYQKVSGTTHLDGDVGDLDLPQLTVQDAGRLLEQAKAKSPEPRANPPGPGVPTPERATPKQLGQLSDLTRSLAWEEAEFLALVAHYGVERPEELTPQHAEEIVTHLLDEARRRQEEAGAPD